SPCVQSRSGRACAPTSARSWTGSSRTGDRPLSTWVGASRLSQSNRGPKLLGSGWTFERKLDRVMTPPAQAGGFSEERLLAPTAASQATAQVSPPGHLSRLAPEGPIRALKRGTPCSPQGLTARYVLRTPRFRRAATAGARGS